MTTALKPPSAPQQPGLKKPGHLSLWQRLEQYWFNRRFKTELATIERIRKLNLTYCGYPKLENICRAIHTVQRRRVPGLYLEAGVALGGSAILIASMKPPQTPLHLYDVFGLIPAPSERDGEDAHKRYAEIASGSSKGLGNNVYYGYVDNLKDKVAQNLSQTGFQPEKHAIELHQGLFSETLNITEPVAFAHIDCDWYDSVKDCIEKITPHMSAGATMVFDDYSSYSGCRQAVDEFLAAHPNFQPLRLERSLTIQKLSL